MSALLLLSDVSAKALNSNEGAHTKNMSAFESDEHLPIPSPLSRLAVGHSWQKA
jgi:hypothetical protein